MLNFRVESWAAVAPGLESPASWQQWLQQPELLPSAFDGVALPQIPAMQRRRFTMLGKGAMRAVLNALDGQSGLPAVFASRHGDTHQTLSLLETLARHEPLSPAAFSLSVHNAIAGLYSIACKDTSALSSIAACQGLLVNTLFEALPLLAEHERVLCVLYDAPLPELYRHSVAGDDFPWAVACVLSRDSGQEITLTTAAQTAPASSEFTEICSLICLLLGEEATASVAANGQCWQLTAGAVA